MADHQGTHLGNITHLIHEPVLGHTYEHIMFNNQYGIMETDENGNGHVKWLDSEGAALVFKAMDIAREK